jgi:TrmH family RNA methyltransferase
MPKYISSLQNPLVKELVLLKEKSRHRRKKGVFLLEGVREIQLAIKGAYVLEQLVICKDICSLESLLEIQDTPHQILEVSIEVYKKIAYRETTEGVIAVVQSKSHTLNTLVFKRETPLLLIAESPEKPGNIGALLRTADAANVDAILIANPKTDLYNPNTIRSSVGCVCTTQIATGSTEEILAYLKKNNISVYAAALHKDATPYYNQDFTKPTAIAVGTEATGLTKDWLENAQQKIIIPMRGKIDSMNVSVAASILLFEATRQRDFQTQNQV